MDMKKKEILAGPFPGQFDPCENFTRSESFLDISDANDA
jgi:hypothetical protein